ncbi:MAG: SDR family oxidoreductase [Desulfotomaculaceae bacterium]|nr:SDR family oxidoreductase [Desulfotomaculaceae bacterium]
MKVLLAGATGNLGKEIFQVLREKQIELVAIARNIELLEPFNDQLIEVCKADVTRPEQLKGIFQKIDTVISTIGLTTYKNNLSHLEVDYQGNLNLLQEARKSGVKNFIYISVYGVDSDLSISLLEAKFKFEQELQHSGLNWLIIRPTGYFTDISKIFIPFVQKGCVYLAGGQETKLNPIHPRDLAEWIGEHLYLSGEIMDIGGPEDFSYREIAEICFKLAGKPTKIKSIPLWVFDTLIKIIRPFSRSKSSLMQFSRWTMTSEFTAPHTGTRKLRDYLIEQLDNSKRT